MNLYIPDNTKIVHFTSADFTKRVVTEPVHLVQYDDTMPILAVTLFDSSNYYKIEDSDILQIKFSKKDHTFVILESLGYDGTRSTCYFEIPFQMTIEEGLHEPIITLIKGDTIAGSSSINFYIDRNPVQDKEIKSTSFWHDLVHYVKEAAKSAVNAESNKNYIYDMLSSGMNYKFINTLPTENISPITTYLIKKQGTTDQFEQWHYKADGTWEQIGLSEINMDDKFYVTTVSLPASSWVYNEDKADYRQEITESHIRPISYVYITSNDEEYYGKYVTGYAQDYKKLMLSADYRPEKDILLYLLIVN